MLDLNYIRKNPDNVKKALESKNISVDIDLVLELDKSYRNLLTDAQRLRELRNENSSSIKNKPDEQTIKKGREIKNDLDKVENALNQAKNDLDKLLWSMPNIPKSDVKMGKSEDENEVIKTVGAPRNFNFEPKDHLELGERLDIIDVKAASKVS